MTQVKPNDHVTVTYEGLLQDGQVFESSADTGPLEFVVGTGAVMPGFEQQLLGMQLNETKTFELAADQAFGPRDQQLIHTLPRQSFGDLAEINPGMVLGLAIDKDGETVQVPALVTDVQGDQITVDFNHPLAGQALTYQVTVTSIGDQPASSGCGCGSSSGSSCGSGCSC